MIERFEISIDCLRDEKRFLTIYVPDDYDGPFPVLYMMDGQNVFFDEDATYGKSWGMYDFLINSRTPIIVVAIDSSRGHNNERLCEYSPFDYDDFKYGFIKSQGKTFIKWLIDDLKPYVDGNYPTFSDRHHTYIAGSSMGGLISYYALLKHNDVFRAAACLSPSLWVDNEKLVNLAKKARIDSDTLIYLDYGSTEAGKGKFARRAFESFWNCVDVLKNKQLDLNIKVIQGGQHNEASWEKQVPTFIDLFLGSDNL